MRTLKDKLNTLGERLEQLSPGVIAVSGGLDSRFLSYFAWRHKLNFHAVFFDGPHITPAEKKIAKQWLADNGPKFTVLPANPLAHEVVRQNTRERCYHCKHALFTRANAFAAELGVNSVLEGSNASDTQKFRPGRKALQELGVYSPMADADLSKPELRAAAAELGLDFPEQPSRPCLLTRFAYGLEPDASLLEHIGHVEDALVLQGLKQFRLRVVARERYVLQLAKEERALWQNLGEQARALLGAHGFARADVHFTKTVSGYYDAEPGQV